MYIYKSNIRVYICTVIYEEVGNLNPRGKCIQYIIIVLISLSIFHSYVSFSLN